MLVSVVIPAYNAEKWVAETIESVLRQSHQDLEIILVDDGSTDRTVEVGETSLRSSLIPYQIIRQKNSGAADARNRGWRAARGDWVQFLDADDLLAPNKIAIQTTAAQTCEADVLYSDWQKLIWCDGAWKPDDLRTPSIQSDAIADLLSDRSFLQLGCLIVRTSALTIVEGFDKSHEPIEDIGLCVKIAIAGGTFFKVPSPDPVAFYRDLPRSFSKVNHRRFIESCIKNAKLAERHIRSKDSFDPRTVDAIVDVYCTGTRFYAGLDWARFEEILDDIEMLQPNFVPKGPRQLNLVSRIAGYRTAEKLAVLYRKAKQLGAAFLRTRAIRT
jgi:glycosyltransferase involved in cell wall biosynthesis